MSEQRTTAAATDLVVRVEMGNDFAPSARLKAALEELSSAMAAEETDEVAGYSFGVDSMGLGMAAGSSADEFIHVHIGCIRIAPTACTCKLGGWNSVPPTTGTPTNP